MAVKSEIPEALLEFLDGIHIWADIDGIISVECNYCNKAGYLFQESTAPDTRTWFPAMFEHLLDRHPERVLRLLESRPV